MARSFVACAGTDSIRRPTRASEVVSSAPCAFAFFRRAAAEAAAACCLAASAGGSSTVSAYSVRMRAERFARSAASLEDGAVEASGNVYVLGRGGSSKPEGPAKSAANNSRVRFAEVRMRCGRVCEDDTSEAAMVARVAFGEPPAIAED